MLAGRADLRGQLFLSHAPNPRCCVSLIAAEFADSGVIHERAAHCFRYICRNLDSCPAGIALFRSKGPLAGRHQGTARPEKAVKIDEAAVA